MRVFVFAAHYFAVNTSGSCLPKYGRLDSVRSRSCSGSPHYCRCARWTTQLCVAFLIHIRTHWLHFARKQMSLPGCKYAVSPTSPN